MQGEHPHDSGEEAEKVGGSRRERRRVETRERLYQAAMKLLSERSFESVTVEMITEGADVGKGTFFNYFASKEAIVGYHFERGLEVMARSLEEEEPEGRKFWDKLMRMTQLIADLDAESRDLTSTLLALTLTNSQVCQASESVHQRAMEQITRIIRAAQEDGELRDDLAAGEVCMFMGGIYFQTLLQWAQGKTPDLHAALDKNFRLAWEGMRPTEPAVKKITEG